MTSAAPKCPRCDYPVLGVEKRIGQPTIYRHAGGVHEDLTADMTVTAALTILAQEIRPRDSVAEGTVVAAVNIGAEERWNKLTGEVTRPRVVTVDSMPARWVVFEIRPDGAHLHGPDTSSISVQTFDYDERVKVLRPAPMDPCECGFPQPSGSDVRPEATNG